MYKMDLSFKKLTMVDKNQTKPNPADSHKLLKRVADQI